MTDQTKSRQGHRDIEVSSETCSGQKWYTNKTVDTKKDQTGGGPSQEKPVPHRTIQFEKYLCKTCWFWLVEMA